MNTFNRRLIYFLILIALSSTFLGCKSSKNFFNTPLFKNVGPYLYYYEGIQNRLYGNPIEAIENLEKSLKLNPNSAPIHYELALNYATIQDVNRGLINAEKAVDLEPYNIYYRNFLGVLYLNTQQISKALNNQRVIVALDSINIYSRYQLALLLSEEKLFDDAVSELNRLEETTGFSPNISETKTRIFLEINDADLAKKEITKLISFNPTHPLYLIFQSDINFREGEDSLGLANIAHAVELNPDFTLGFIELYQRYLESGQHIEALTILQTIFNDHSLPENEVVRLFYPLLFDQTFYLHHLPSLDSLFHLALVKHPTSLFINELGYEHNIRKQNFGEARQYLDFLKTYDKNNPLRWERIINFDYSLRNTEMVVYNSTKAMNLFPDNYIFYIFNSITLGDENNFYGAIEVLKKGTKYVTAKKDLSELYGSIGDFYFRLNKLNKSFKAYNTSIKFNNSNARALNNYSYYLAINNLNLPKALAMSSIAVDLEPNNSTYIDTKGWVLFTMSRYEEAREVLRNAIAKSGSTSAVINEHYGDALFMTGNTESAYIYWLKAKEIGGGSDKLEEKLRLKTYVP